jgi:regulator of protease activity HflC (stomatin/prohibitin superfamily)
MAVFKSLSIVLELVKAGIFGAIAWWRERKIKKQLIKEAETDAQLRRAEAEKTAALLREDAERQVQEIDKAPTDTVVDMLKYRSKRTAI